MTLREHIMQKRRPWCACFVAGLLLYVPFCYCFLVASKESGDFSTLLAILALVGLVLLVVGAIELGRTACPKCGGRLSRFPIATARYCLHCGADLDSEL
jgi:hypothetical protein